jgi:hypothetical protein
MTEAEFEQYLRSPFGYETGELILRLCGEFPSGLEERFHPSSIKPIDPSLPHGGEGEDKMSCERSKVPVEQAAAMIIMSFERRSPEERALILAAIARRWCLGCGEAHPHECQIK